MHRSDARTSVACPLQNQDGSEHMRPVAEDHGVPAATFLESFVEALCGRCSCDHPAREIDGFELIHDATEDYIGS